MRQHQPTPTVDSPPSPLPGTPPGGRRPPPGPRLRDAIRTAALMLTAPVALWAFAAQALGLERNSVNLWTALGLLALSWAGLTALLLILQKHH